MCWTVMSFLEPCWMPASPSSPCWVLKTKTHPNTATVIKYTFITPSLLSLPWSTILCHTLLIVPICTTNSSLAFLIPLLPSCSPVPQEFSLRLIPKTLQNDKDHIHSPLGSSSRALCTTCSAHQSIHRGSSGRRTAHQLQGQELWTLSPHLTLWAVTGTKP